MVRPACLTAVLGALLFGCVIRLVVVSCAGVRSEAPQGEEQEHTEATRQEQEITEATEATASEEARCDRTRRIKAYGLSWVTNDVPGCPNGGLLSGTDGQDKLYGREGEDEIHGLGGSDFIFGGLGKDVIYGGPGNDEMIGDLGDDVLYGGDGNDHIGGGEGKDVLYGEEGNDYPSGRGDGGIGTSSIAVKARTITWLTKPTTWTAVARRRLG